MQDQAASKLLDFMAENALASGESPSDWPGYRVLANK
jgi:hypothetical protein|eukprot:SAG25_NODE_1078_length_4097_cov_12.124562_3_plen_37_part_00